jgi:hypothetical protein
MTGHNQLLYDFIVLAYYWLWHSFTQDMDTLNLLYLSPPLPLLPMFSNFGLLAASCNLDLSIHLMTYSGFHIDFVLVLAREVDVEVAGVVCSVLRTRRIWDEIHKNCEWNSQTLLNLSI